jgi:hypothetical protein
MDYDPGSDLFYQGWGRRKDFKIVNHGGHEGNLLGTFADAGAIDCLWGSARPAA